MSADLGLVTGSTADSAAASQRPALPAGSLVVSMRPVGSRPPFVIIPECGYMLVRDVPDEVYRLP